MFVAISILGPCVQRKNADPVLAMEHFEDPVLAMEYSEVQTVEATCMSQPHVTVEPKRNEGVSSAVYEEIHDIDIRIRHQQAEESSSHYAELRERNSMQTVYYERLRVL